MGHEKFSLTLKNIRSNTRNGERKNIKSFFVEPFEINEEKYLNRDQKYLNLLNNNIIKTKIKTIVDLNQKKQKFCYR